MNKLEKKREYDKRWREKNKEYSKEYFRKRRQTVEGRFTRYKSSSKSRGLEFKLNFKEFKSIITKPCHYCGVSGKLLGIDRKDNRVGYTLDNSLPCCWPCNRFKSSKPYDFFVDICKKIGSHLQN